MQFFDRLQALRLSQPHPCILTVRSENSDYCPYHASGKDSYMIVGHNMAWECFYGFWVGNCKNCTDCAFIEKSELCYESMDIHECYDCTFCQDCVSCTECEWCYDCKGCMSCYGCVNLRNKEFYIFNKKYSREDYFEKLKELRTHGRNMENPPREFAELKETLPHIAMQGVNNENVTGDHIFNSRNVYFGFDVSDQEDTMYMYNASGSKDCMDVIYTGQDSEMNYMCHSAVNLKYSNFCDVCWFSQNLEYCEYVFNSHDCFGCISRNRAEYEILNQKYSKDEYFKKLAQIKDELRKEDTYGRWWWPSQYKEVEPFCSFMA